MSILHLSVKLTGVEFPCEGRYSSELTLSQFKEKLEMVTGIPSTAMKLKLHDQTDKFLADLDSETMTLGQLGVADKAIVRVSELPGCSALFAASTTAGGDLSSRYLTNDAVNDAGSGAAEQITLADILNEQRRANEGINKKLQRQIDLLEREETRRASQCGLPLTDVTFSLEVLSSSYVLHAASMLMTLAFSVCGAAESYEIGDLVNTWRFWLIVVSTLMSAGALVCFAVVAYRRTQQKKAITPMDAENGDAGHLASAGQRAGDGEDSLSLNYVEKSARFRRNQPAAGQPSKITLKTPKGTRDFGPEQMAIRLRVIGQITDIFQRHGAVTIDTPVFELRDVLMGKYGEEGSKLVFDLVDQGGELCSLRYDLTVPFARYLAMNKVKNLKRYQIAKVYRRDQPVMTKGRYREFYQCDFDIAGQYELMVPEAECLKIADEILSTLDIGDYEIRLNHRVLLEGMFEASGIPAADFKTVCSSVDKLDKQPWAEIEQELTGEKKIAPEAVKKLEAFVRLRETNPELDNADLLTELLKRSPSSTAGDGQTSAGGAEAKLRLAVEELRTLLDYSACLKCTPGRVVFEPSLARGLDYYTGAIYEVVVKEFSFNSTSATASVSPPTAALKDADPSSGPIGSVAAGGRYDHLVGMFHAAKKRDSNVPCVGISFGIERLFSIMELKAASTKGDGNAPREIPTDVFVASAQKNMLRSRMEVVSRLWAAGINAEISYKANSKMLNQQYCEENRIPWTVIIGEDELKDGSVKLRDVASRKKENVKLDDLTEVLKNKLKAGDE